MATAAGGTRTGDEGASGLERARREYESSAETKPGFRTSEFLSSVVAALGILIAALIEDGFAAEEAWRLIAFLSVGYMISRGLAKIGVGRRGNS